MDIPNVIKLKYQFLIILRVQLHSLVSAWVYPKHVAECGF